MARARNIKPGLFKNEVLGVADPLYTLLFVGLWTLADREGRLEDRPLRIKGEVFPYRDGIDVVAILAWLEERGFIQRYIVGDKSIIQILQFAKHQTPHGTEKDSELPDTKGLLTVHKRVRNGYATGEYELVDSGLTVKEPTNNLLTPDSGFLIPDSGFLIPDTSPNGEVVPSQKPSRSPPIAKPADVAEQVWKDWVALRTKKRTTVSETALEGARAEAAKADLSLDAFLRIWVTRGSQGMQAAWIKPEERRTAAAASKSFAERDRDAGMARWEQMTGKIHPDRNHTGAVMDVPPTNQLRIAT